MESKRFPDNLFDKKGIKISEDDVIYDGTYYFRIWWNNIRSSIEAFCPKYGYLIDADTADYSKFERIGTYDEKEEFLDKLYKGL